MKQQDTNIETVMHNQQFTQLSQALTDAIITMQQKSKVTLALTAIWYHPDTTEAQRQLIMSILRGEHGQS